MDIEAWLEQRTPDFHLLSREERDAIKSFLLLWIFYEGRVLNRSGSAGAIVSAVQYLEDNGALNLQPFAPAIEHFRNRYFDGAELTDAFRGLHLRQNDHPDLVKSAMRGQLLVDRDVLSAILIIVFRLRNNLIHGVKTEYGIRGQLENFRNASLVLMAAMELHGA